MPTVTIATRKSALALAQARAWMQDFSKASGWQTQELHVVTTGDRIQDRALSLVGGKGLFIKEIEEAILAGEAQAAVHSLKDVPAELVKELTLGCIPKREDPRDVVVTRTGCHFTELPAGAKVGTSSLRRMYQLQKLRPDLAFEPIRGNVDTRLRKCEEGVVDAVILAASGMHRLGLNARYTHPLEPEVCLPAIGQGALAIELREDNAALAQALKAVHCPQTARIVAAERGIMLAVEGSCQVPVAGFGVREQQTEDQLWLRGMLAEANGSNMQFRECRVPWPGDDQAAFEIGMTLGKELKATR